MKKEIIIGVAYMATLLVASSLNLAVGINGIRKSLKEDEDIKISDAFGVVSGIFGMRLLYQFTK